MFDDLRNSEFQKNFPLIGIDKESEFHDFWCDHLVSEKDLVLRAFKGGMSSDRFAWIFLSGYQSAIQHTFPEISSDCWSSFAVSEDKKGELSGLDWHQSEKGFLLNGYKTWVAAVDQMQMIIVKAGRGDRAIYLAVERDHSNLVLTRKEQGFLAEMSEGIACFQDAMVSETKILSNANVKEFGKREVLYIYLAFCGLVVSRSKDDTVIEKAWSIAETISSEILGGNDFPKLKKIDLDVQELRVKAEPNMLGVCRWQTDQKLIAMYSKGIQTRPD